MIQKRTALLSVSDKTGIVDLARALVDRDWRIVSTGGTAAALAEGGVPVLSVSQLTGFPEMLAGRVKTLHPAVHAGILARRSAPDDMAAVERQGIQPIDLVAVNLYPFRETVSRTNVPLAEAVEQIDIGGPTLLRAAAKNHEGVVVLCDPQDYGEALALLDGEAVGGAEADELATRRRLAAKVYAHTAAYDAAVAGFLESAGDGATGPPEAALISLVRLQELRYGENPDQAASFYRDACRPPWGIAGMEQLHGKELSYNNLLDLDGALAALAPFLADSRAACAIVKHTTPCGLALADSTALAFERARACDPVSAFGSTVVFNQVLSEVAAEGLEGLFVECLVAPGFAQAALEALQRKKNLRILAPKSGQLLAYPGHLMPGLDARGVQGGLLLQSAPVPAGEDLRRSAGAVVSTRREPSAREWEDLTFAWAAVQGVKSNAIVLARDGATIGIGAGQMSRVDAVRLAGWKAAEAGHATEGSLLASDAFFPFRDGLDAAAELGVAAVVQPGGSVRDDEVTAAADEHGIAMLLTKARLFRH